MRCHFSLKHRDDALNHAMSQLSGAAGRLMSIDPVGVFHGTEGFHPDCRVLQTVTSRHR
jgi:hypothetical protein